MTKTRRIVWVSALIAMLATVNAFSQDMDDLRNSLDELSERKIAALLSGNYDELSDFYTEDAISMPNYDELLYGIKEIIGFAEKSQNSEYRLREMKLKPVEYYYEGDLLVEVGTLKMKVTGPGIPAFVQENGKYMNVWERQDDGIWRIKAEIWNTDANPLDRMPKSDKKRKKRK